MSGSAYIQARQTDSGPRYDVRYRRGGAAFKIQRAGTFRTKKDAVLRRDMVRGWLAQGKDPEVELNALLQEVRAERAIQELWPVWVGSLKDVGDGRRKTIANAYRKIDPIIGHMTPEMVTVEDAMRLVQSMEGDMKASTLGSYFGVARQFMDAHVRENPLRSKLIRLPKDQREDVVAMSFQEWKMLREGMRDSMDGKLTIGPALAFAMDFIEVTAVRVGDAAQLLCGDIDFYESKVRISKARGKSSRSRWVGIPLVMRDEIQARGLKPTDLVFPELSKHSLYNAMEATCKRLGLPHYHPHDLRHRRTSVWLHQGMPIMDVTARVGHADASTTLNVYAHVVASGEDIWADSDFFGGKR